MVATALAMTSGWYRYIGGVTKTLTGILLVRSIARGSHDQAKGARPFSWNHGWI